MTQRSGSRCERDDMRLLGEHPWALMRRMKQTVGQSRDWARPRHVGFTRASPEPEAAQGSNLGGEARDSPTAQKHHLSWSLQNRIVVQTTTPRRERRTGCLQRTGRFIYRMLHCLSTGKKKQNYSNETVEISRLFSNV